VFRPEISSFALYLATEGKSARTIRTDTEAAAWFAAVWLAGRTACTGWEQAGKQDVQRWMVHLLSRYSPAYASNQYRGLQQFFKWLAAEEELPDPMEGLRPPKVPAKLVPVFTGAELAALEHVCAGRRFAQRRDAAIIAVFRATGIRLSELAGLRYSPDRPGQGDVDLLGREITVTGKGGKPRIVKISRDAARSLDRYIRSRSRHAQAWRPQLWPERERARSADRQRHLPGHRTARRPGEGGGAPAPVPARFQPHLAGPGRPEGDLWNVSDPPASPRSAKFLVGQGRDQVRGHLPQRQDPRHRLCLRDYQRQRGRLPRHRPLRQLRLRG
jgi:integrase/recombinase XerD